MATWRFSLVSVARYTSPMPPRPSKSANSKTPNRVPGVRAKRLDYMGVGVFRRRLLLQHGLVRDMRTHDCVDDTPGPMAGARFHGLSVSQISRRPGSIGEARSTLPVTHQSGNGLWADEPRGSSAHRHSPLRRTRRNRRRERRLRGCSAQPMVGMPRPRQIFRARLLPISVWRGTASTAPLAGFVHSECAAPSRFSVHPCLRRCCSSVLRFTRP